MFDRLRIICRNLKQFLEDLSIDYDAETAHREDASTAEMQPFTNLIQKFCLSGKPLWMLLPGTGGPGCGWYRGTVTSVGYNWFEFTVMNAETSEIDAVMIVPETSVMNILTWDIVWQKDIFNGLYANVGGGTSKHRDDSPEGDVLA